ncbi:MAG: hypothetical protein JXA71_12545, partial [Chitinispirillaceae bacterium]|nr:hypothetical protein [Chitinispirillaceae bacterium]
DNWGNTANEATARYSEYKNTGAGATTTNRVSWAKQLTDAQAANYTYANVLKTTYANPPVTDNWNPMATLNLYLPGSTGAVHQESTFGGSFGVFIGPDNRTVRLSGMVPGTIALLSVHSLDGKTVKNVWITGDHPEADLPADLVKGAYIVRARSCGNEVRTMITR